jgi:hypothetical protein
MPKTAGASFLATLRDVYGPTLHVDYEDMAALQAYFLTGVSGAVSKTRPVSEFTSYRCIHGHFAAPKYGAFAADVQHLFITWLRDPLQRLHSHYHFWRRAFDPTTAGPIWQRFIAEKWSLERFCLGPEYRNVYHKYLCGFPAARLDFVGVVERYDADLDLLGRTLLGSALAPHSANRNTQVSGSYPVDPGLRRDIEAYHSEDYELYRQALAQPLRRYVLPNAI